MVRRLFSVMLGFALCMSVLAVVGVSSAGAVDTPGGRLPSTQPARGTPHVLDGRVLSIAEVGNTILLGGTFTKARNDGSSNEVSRSNLLAFDKTTGQISTSFVPQPTGTVEVILPAGDGQTVYVGGSFGSIGGLARKNLVRLNVSNGSVVPGFKPGNITGKVNDLRLAGGRLWVAGGFTSVNGQAQKALATLNPTTGAVDPYMALAIDGIHNGGSTSVSKIDVTPDGRDLVAIGNFRTLQGVRTQQVLRLDLSNPASAQPENWQTAFYETTCGTAWYSVVTDVDISPDGTFFIVTTTGGYGGATTSCDSSSRWEIATQGSGVRPSWLNKTGGDTLWSVEITDSVAYLGGHPRWQNNPFLSNQPGPGAVSRPGIAAVDPSNGLPLSWNPTRTRGVGVFDFLAADEGLYVASDTDRIGDFQYRGRIALMPWAGGSTFAARRTPGLPNDLYAVSGNQLVKHAATTTSFGAPSPVPSGVAWDSVKGAFMLNGEVYLAMSDGTFVKRSFDGQSWGEPVAVNTQDQITPLTAWADDIRAMTGMFYDSGRIYFTRAKTNQLFYRYLTPESGVVGATRHVASGPVTGIAFDQVDGMFLAGDRLYWTNSLSQLRSIQWAQGDLSGAPVAGTADVVSGSPVDQNDWRAPRSTFLFQDSAGKNAGGAPPAQAPTASFSSSCVELTCSFDGSGSTAGTGTITDYSWSFGDGSTGTGATTQRSYTTEGSYSVTLTVTNSAGLTSTSTQVVAPKGPAAPQPPVASFTASCSVLECTFDGSGSTDPDGSPADLGYSWDFGDGSTATGAQPSHTYAAAGTYQVKLTVTDKDNLPSSTTKAVSPTQASVVPVAAASTNGNRLAHRVTIPAAVQAGDRLLLLMTVNNTAAGITGPDGWSLVPGGAVDGSGMRQRVWTKVASAADSGSVVQVDTSAYTKSDLTVAAYRGSPGAALAVTASAGAVQAGGLSAYATPEVDLPATGSSWVLSYWASKSGEGRTWSSPATEVDRARTSGAGSGAISALLADSGEGANGSRGGGLVGTLNSSASQAQTFTVVVTATSG